jgi:hypothetical protein
MMTSRALLNLGLAIVAIALVLVVIYRPGIEPGPVPLRLTSALDPAAVISITVRRDLRPPLTLTRQADDWYVFTGEREVPAAGFQVNALLRLLTTTATQHYSVATLDPAALGLEPPQATVSIDDLEFRFGATGALENRRYVQHRDMVYLIDDQYQHLVNADWASFVNRRLIGNRDAITRLELPDMTLERTAGENWQVEPAQDTTTADALQTLVDNWQQVQALYVRTYAGTDSSETVTIHTQDAGLPIELQIISHAPDLVIARPDWGIQYHLTTGLEDSLFTLPAPDKALEEQPDPATDSAESNEE